jgi:glutamate/tyrosine decarboxylase-like PLP-dependent enzyme
MRDAGLAALYARIAEYVAHRRAGDDERRHAPDLSYEAQVKRFALDLSREGAPAEQVINELIDIAEPGLAAMTGPRFFGWVIGASNPVGVAADWLTSAWGQNTANHFATPSASAAEAAAAAALLELMDLPRESSVGFVTGATMAGFTCLAAARSEMLRRAGWDLESEGMAGSPPITVILGAEAHSTIFAGLKYLGFGERRLMTVDVDANGAILADAAVAAIHSVSGPVIVIAQAGHINSGSFDPFREIAAACRAKNAWLHIDGAFGLWARATETHRKLGEGIELADSWSVDGHKWLQTPYDSAYAIVKHREAHVRAMQIAASYLPSAGSGVRVPADYVPELSRRARGFATWAMIRLLGRRGIAEMVSRHCALARRMALLLAAAGAEILNDVVLNQVAVHFGSDAETQATIAKVQADGVCFVGGAQWRGRQVMRVSVTNENTTEADVDRSVAAMLAAWMAVRGKATSAG